jgi:hypothetical protein
MVFGSGFPYKQDHVVSLTLNTMTRSSSACSQKISYTSSLLKTAAPQHETSTHPGSAFSEAFHFTAPAFHIFQVPNLMNVVGRFIRAAIHVFQMPPKPIHISGAHPPGFLDIGQHKL